MIWIFTLPQATDGSRDKDWIRLCVAQSLILSFCLAACFKNADTNTALSLQWKDSLATGLIIPQKLFSQVPDDSIKSLLHVHLIQDSLKPPIFGGYLLSDDSVVFQPLIPFTRGLVYNVRFKDRSLGSIKIPFSGPGNAPEVLAVFPTQDTLPENLLKIYIQFSRPMREGQPLENVALLKNGRDTVPEVFLDLQPALWNKEGTMLTLWLDPGRIKRDLQPNKKMGSPLLKGEVYELLIKKNWQATDGASLTRSFRKDFVVNARDSLSPDPDLWTIETPQEGTIQPLKIKFHETLDYVLLKEAFDLHDQEGKVVDGETNIIDEETALVFMPFSTWQSGTYTVRSESRLEDVAGNNLNRLFDNDITLKKPDMEKEIFEIEFRVE